MKKIRIRKKKLKLNTYLVSRLSERAHSHLSQQQQASSQQAACLQQRPAAQSGAHKKYDETKKVYACACALRLRRSVFRVRPCGACVRSKRRK